MFIAHLPAGYLLSEGFRGLPMRGVVPVALLGSIFPDLDLIYFYTIDNRQHHHHSYWIHFPLVWGGLLAAAVVWFYFRRQSRLAALFLVFSASGFLHLLLDTVVGDIPWLAPFSMKFYHLSEVQAVYKPWWLNFILHWSFLLEVLIVAAAVVLFVKRRKQACKKPASVEKNDVEG